VLWFATEVLKFTIAKFSLYTMYFFKKSIAIINSTKLVLK